ncbi:STAS domain-containing protein [Nucisporomicrobium flavum]|uniref:STAS domain-containing protein n=1 Tax=Nucisporomicrobium flavum TaxID=2785915 RepID=UPI0018F2C3C8|nr:STAS domain-containing protein [Nucisporomicrobium flavum]
MSLQLAARDGRACTVVEVGGQVDMATGPELNDFLGQVTTDRRDRPVVLDLAGVSFLDSSGIGVLLVWFKELQGAGGRLCVAGLQEPVAYVLRVTAVDQVLDVYDSAEAAEADMPPVVR